mmetsp:Transcript_10075/g.27440  ORF Transcript_10075/g.27440 Transcript_10075/m.27440 type:complete len:200 (-) Transcript_10075:319-918(-)
MKPVKTKLLKRCWLQCEPRARPDFFKIFMQINNNKLISSDVAQIERLRGSAVRAPGSGHSLFLGACRTSRLAGADERRRGAAEQGERSGWHTPREGSLFVRVELGDGGRVALKHVPVVPLSMVGVRGHPVDQIVLQPHMRHALKLLLCHTPCSQRGILLDSRGWLDLRPQRRAKLRRVLRDGIWSTNEDRWHAGSKLGR